ncbi:MAG: glutamate--tRNA ligase [Candidatus Paceibacterota bacterium]
MESGELKKEIILTVFPEQLKTPNELENLYPPRELPEGARVTRIAPSPTGFMHIGHLYIGLISERLAHQSGGVFYLRFEDTDKKREVEGSKELAIRSLSYFDIVGDEGVDDQGHEKGSYGPYIQSERKNIYHTYIKKLLEQDEAYLCFCTAEDLTKMREEQGEKKVRPGYYGEWATWRNKTPEEVQLALKKERLFVIRFKSDGKSDNKITVDDNILGKRELPENDQDIVIMKSDGLPTYHLAHVVDDHLMKTTNVVRGDEWLSSLPLHLQLFETFGWKAPNYAHIAPIQKMEGSTRRKLSKRKDPESNVDYFIEQGYPKEAVTEYLINLANSNFEDWRRANIDKNYKDFPFSLEKLKSSSGALFDINKLDNISKDVVSRFSPDEVYELFVSWAKDNAPELVSVIENNPDYTKAIFTIERNTGPKSRKDITKWSDVGRDIGYFFDEVFQHDPSVLTEQIKNVSHAEIKSMVQEFIDSYDESDSKDSWFMKVKIIAHDHGFAESTSVFKKNPTAFKGGVADVAKIFRILLTGKPETPDLYSIMQVMGKDRILKRLSSIF